MQLPVSAVTCWDVYGTSWITGLMSAAVAAGAIVQLRNEPQHFLNKNVSNNVLIAFLYSLLFLWFSIMFYQNRWEANKLFPLHSYLNAARLKLFEPSKILKWTPRHEFVGFVFHEGCRDLVTELNICRSMATSCGQITYLCHKTFIPSFVLCRQYKEKYNIFTREWRWT